MIARLTYQNGPLQGSHKDFGEAEIQVGQSKVICRHDGTKASMEVVTGAVFMGVEGRSGKNRVTGSVDLRPGDLVILQETSLLFSLEKGELKAPPAPKPKPSGVVVERKAPPREDGPAILIASSRKPAPAEGGDKPAEEAAAPAPAPARWLFFFLAPEKQKNAYYQLLVVLFLLLLSFAVGVGVGTNTKIKEPPGATLEPYIRDTLHIRAQELGWSYPKLIQELTKATPNKERPLAVWWLTLPKKDSKP